MHSLTKFILRRQWYIGPKIPNDKINWQCLKLTTTANLYYHNDQNVISLVKSTYSIVIVGIAINPHNLSQNVLENIASAYEVNKVENFIITLGGTYIVLVVSNDKINIYNDPAGMMGVYFDSKGRASSTINLLSSVLKNKNDDLNFKFKPGNDWYTGSYTPYVDIKKLIPNFCLELQSGKTVRFWPKPSNIIINFQNISTTIDQICDLLQKMMVGVTTHGEVLCSITGGQDSRVVLASCKENWKNLRFFTLKGSSVHKDDIRYAALLAEKSNVKHQFFDIIPNSSWIDELYNEIGMNEAIGTRREIAETCLQLEGNDTIHVNGNLGALCKSFYWQNSNPSKFTFSAVSRDFVQPTQLIINGIAEWKSTIPEIEDAAILYNLFYLEQRAGRWISAGENCSRIFYETYTPFNHRDIFILINSLPKNIQYGGKILKLLVKNMAPELLEIPYCIAKRNWSKFVPGKMKFLLKSLLKK